MQHVIQIGINIDDDAIRRGVEAEAQKQIIDALRKDVEKVIFPPKSYYNDNINKNQFTEYVKDMMTDFLNDNKDAIIQCAASCLVDRIVKTKKFKEAVDGVIGVDR